MEKHTEIESSENNVSVNGYMENTQEFHTERDTDSTKIHSSNILISVNSFKNKEIEEEPDDDWLTNDDVQYELTSEEITEISEGYDNTVSDNSNDSGLNNTKDCISNIDKLISTDDVEEYDVDEFEDDDDSADGETEKKRNIKKIGCISCSTVFLLIIILVASLTSTFYHYYRLMNIDEEDDIYFNNNVTFSDTEISDIPDGKVEIEEGTVFKDKDVFNIMLIGTDERTKGFSKNARADSIMILSLDNNNKRIRLVSLERGMLVNIPGRKNDILTHTFRYGGSKLLLETVRTHFKLDVDKYVRVNFSMFEKLVDEVGGVDITLTEQEAYGLNKPSNRNTKKLKRKVYAGVNHFNGYEALQYARLRWIDDDFHRIERQREVIIAIKENLTDLSVSDLKDISEDCLPYVQTNLSAMEFADLLIKMPGYFDNEVSQLTIPKKGTYKTLGHVDFKENTRILNEFLYGTQE